MNVKSLLLAAVIATVGSTAYANNYVDSGVEIQMAQATVTAPAARSMAASRAASVQNLYQSRSDILPFVPTANDGRSRAEVRAETVRALNSGEARALRSVYPGGAQ